MGVNVQFVPGGGEGEGRNLSQWGEGRVGEHLGEGGEGGQAV